MTRCNSWTQVLVVVMIPLMAFLLAAASPVLANGPPAPLCTQSRVPIRVHSRNYDLRRDPSMATPMMLSATYNIGLHFCEPGTRDAKTLLVLLHGATYDSVYWDFPYQADTYSFVRHAVARGYATLSVDRLGTGLSDRPDPLNAVQFPSEVEIVKKILALARSGGIPTGVRTHCAFEKIVLVGHSMGSVLSNCIINAAPELVSAVVFTGFSHFPLSKETNDAAGIVPAPDASPRFATYDPNYLSTRDLASRTAVFFGPHGKYDPRVAEVDEGLKDVVPAGVIATLGMCITAAPNFAGDVLLITGDHDLIFCDPDKSCRNVLNEGMYYPRARSFESVLVPDTAHNLNLHLNAPQTYGKITGWLARHEY
ncbi:alpha/beta-hydrolase [Auricularia subglabra TFB-10046 SS5]|nr:alpha/beta-hydrolase [Auricularia subglabra TFB-10046 SS5]